MADYPNRSDLQNSATSTARFTGQTYGEATAQEASQQAVRPGTSPATLQGQAAAAQAPRPGAKTFNRPTERPNEPLTAGADFGAGPGSLEAGVTPRIIPQDDTVMRLRELYRMYPNDGLRMLVERYSGMSI
jgi:hypothetical protein